ncbi:DUF1917-domain-containing protein, partial [Lophiostoma macrostomum CBS 122681]
MVEEELVSGDGWISDDSSFYGDEDNQERLLSLSETFRPKKFWAAHKRNLNVYLAKSRNMPPPDLHNIYAGQFDAYQLHESIDDFIKRLPPLTTTIELCPWIWAANPHPRGRDRSGRAKVQEELIPKGTELLHQSLEKRAEIRTKNSHLVKGSVTRLLNQESESLKSSIAKLAEESNILSGKWMLFPKLEDVTRVWKLIVDGTINNRLGSGSKVATEQDGKPERLICVYTKDFRDTDDVLRVLKELVTMGLVNPGRGIYYKSDAYTYLDIYGQNAAEYGLQASVYSSQKLLASASLPQA